MSENKIITDVEDYIDNEEGFKMSEVGCGCGCGENPGEIADVEHHPHGVTCTRLHTQAADVSLPVKVKPYAKMGTIETRCCGEPAVAIRHCSGSEGCGCDLLITQTICARIPIEYGVTATTGEVTINCRRQPEGK